MRRRTSRIYYGGEGRELERWWTVRVTDAKRDVTVNGNAAQALAAYQGVTIGCAVSNVVIQPDNAKTFPHPVLLVAVTKSSVLVVDRLNRSGQPSHAVRYHHNYGHIVDRNDRGTLKKMVAENPSIMERAFTLRVPRKFRSGEWPDRKSGRKTVRTVYRGALRRAIEAGLISEAASNQLDAR